MSEVIARNSQTDEPENTGPTGDLCTAGLQASEIRLISKSGELKWDKRIAKKVRYRDHFITNESDLRMK